MRKISLIVLMSLGAVTAAFAQSPGNGITTSTDPAKVAAVERHAQDLKSRQAAPSQPKPAARRATSAKAKTHAHKTAHSKPKASIVPHSTSAKR